MNSEMLMNAKSTGRKASTKITRQLAAATTKSARAVSPSKAAAAATPVALTATSKRRASKINALIAQPAPTASVGTTKQARLIALLGSAAGASITQMIALTGWQAHTVRGTISGVLRKRLGLNVACASGDAGVRVYRIVTTTSA